MIPIPYNQNPQQSITTTKSIPATIVQTKQDCIDKSIKKMMIQEKDIVVAPLPTQTIITTTIASSSDDEEKLGRL